VLVCAQVEPARGPEIPGDGIDPGRPDLIARALTGKRLMTGHQAAARQRPQARARRVARDSEQRLYVLGDDDAMLRDERQQLEVAASEPDP
jgi:hypothetical protein